MQTISTIESSTAKVTGPPKSLDDSDRGPRHGGFPVVRNLGYRRRPAVCSGGADGLCVAGCCHDSGAHSVGPPPAAVADLAVGVHDRGVCALHSRGNLERLPPDPWECHRDSLSSSGHPHPAGLRASRDSPPGLLTKQSARGGPNERDTGRFHRRARSRVSCLGVYGPARPLCSSRRRTWSRSFSPPTLRCPSSWWW